MPSQNGKSAGVDFVAEADGEATETVVYALLIINGEPVGFRPEEGISDMPEAISYLMDEEQKAEEAIRQTLIAIEAITMMQDDECSSSATVLEQLSLGLGWLTDEDPEIMINEYRARRVLEEAEHFLDQLNFTPLPTTCR